MKAFLAVDGSNLYHRLKEIDIKVDYNALAEWLAGDDELITKKFYVGRVKADPANEKAVAMMAGQQKLLTHLKKSGWEVTEGYLFELRRRRLSLQLSKKQTGRIHRFLA